MDSISHYSAYTPAKTSAASQTGARTPDVTGISGDAFRRMLEEQGVRAPDRSRFLCSGAETRAGLSGTELTGDEEKKALIRQLADSSSDFYVNMRAALKAQVKKTQEDEEQQAIVEALMAVLDAMSAKKDVSGEKEDVGKSATDLTRKIGDRIARLRREKPNDPEAAKEIARLESMLRRLQEIGFYVDVDDTDDWWQDEDENFETLTQLLTRRQAEEIQAAHPIEKEVNETE